MRKAKSDPAAFQAAEEYLTDSVGLTPDAGNSAVMAFIGAEFETATSKVAGEEIKLRRIVLTTEWEVAPK